MITVGCRGGTYDQKPFAHPGSKQLQTSATSCLYAPASCLFLLQHDVKFSPVRCREEFALSRLKKELSEDGVYHLRWSALDSRRILLTVMNSSPVGHAEDSMAVVQDTYTSYTSYTYCAPPIHPGRFEASPQAVQNPSAGLQVLPRELGPGILQREGTHGQSQDLGAQVWRGQLHHQEVLFPQDRRLNTELQC